MRLAASAYGIHGVASVQLQIDAANVGAAITTAGSSVPYAFEMIWDSRAVANGLHTITAMTTDNQGNQHASAPVAILVAN